MLAREKPALPSLDQLKDDFLAKHAAYKADEKKLKKSRVDAAKALLKLKQHVETHLSERWWTWHFHNIEDKGTGERIGHSRSNSEKLLAIAGADDPTAAHEKEKEPNKLRMREKRAAIAATAKQPETVESDPEISATQVHVLRNQPQHNLCVRSNCVKAREFLTEVKASIDPSEWERLVPIWPEVDDFIEGKI